MITTTTTTPPRYNSAMKFEDFAPKRKDGLCRCGCGRRARRSWATDQCPKPLLIKFRILKGDVGVIRAELLKRDGGKCAHCGLEAEAERARCLRWLYRGQFGTDEEYRIARVEIETLRARFMRLGYPSPDTTWWQADHILEVVRGGGGCDLSGYQTLCHVCHAAKTALLNLQLSAARRASKHAARRVPPRLPVNSREAGETNTGLA